MFLVTLFNPETAKLVRKTFHVLHDAEEYCDYCFNCGLAVWSLEKVEIIEW